MKQVYNTPRAALVLEREESGVRLSMQLIDGSSVKLFYDEAWLADIMHWVERVHNPLNSRVVYPHSVGGVYTTQFGSAMSVGISLRLELDWWHRPCLTLVNIRTGDLRTCDPSLFVDKITFCLSPKPKHWLPHLWFLCFGRYDDVMAQRMSNMAAMFDIE